MSLAHIELLVEEPSMEAFLRASVREGVAIAAGEPAGGREDARRVLLARRPRAARPREVENRPLVG
jgi:hypothetical protein